MKTILNGIAKLYMANMYGKKADMPVWSRFLALILAVLLLVFLIWLAVRSGQAGVEVFGEMP
jgi:hypothetical protein